MANAYSYSEMNPYTQGAFSFAVGLNLGCDTDESYIADPQILFTDYALIVNDNTYNYSGGSIGRPTGWTSPYAFFIERYEDPAAYPVNFANTGEVYIYNDDMGQMGLPAADGYRYDSVKDLICSIDTNVPVFETSTEAYTYVNMEDATQRKQYLKDNALNYKSGDVSPDGQEFRLEVQWTTSTWVNDNQPQVIGQPNLQGVKGKIVDGKFALYRISGIDDGKLKYGIKNTATFYDLEYTTDGVSWTPTSTFPFEFIYRPRINELGTFSYALSLWNSDIPIWKNEDDADDYINDEKPITDAENWDKISPQYPPQNPTGEPEDETEFGEVYTRNVFSQLYLCNVGALYEISNALFDYDVTTLSGLWEDIKKGLEMYGSDPMEVVQGLRYYPFDLSQYFTSVQSQNYIYFGAYQLQLEQSSVQKLLYCNGYIDLGTVDIKRSYNDWRDFEPYTKLSIYLPYVGTFPLDAKKYYGKSVNIRYFIDLRTGACTACLIANGVLLDWFDGIIGTEMPITLTDYSSYAQSQLNIIMRNAGIGIAAEGMSGNVISKVMKGSLNYIDNANAAQAAAQSTPLQSSLASQTSAQYAGVAVGAAAVGSAALVGGVAVGTAMKTSFDMMRSGTAAHTKTRPASSAMINQYLPQYPYFRFEIMEIDETPYLNELYGRPSNASGIIANFRGYLEAEDVMLICPIATDNERQEIIDLVRTGIYI